jgi:hypothetical protein
LLCTTIILSLVLVSAKGEARLLVRLSDLCLWRSAGTTKWVPKWLHGIGLSLILE